MKIRFRSEKAEQPNRDRGMRVLYGPARRSGYRARWYLILALVAIPIIYLAYSLGSMVFVSELPGQVVLQSHPVRAPVDGVVARLSVATGDRIETGAPLVRLAHSPLQARLTQAQAELSAVTASERRLDKAFDKVETRWSEEVASVESRVRSLERLRSEGAATAGEVREARERLASARRLKAQSQADNRASRLSLAQRRSTLAAEVSALREQARGLDVTAPEDGRVAEVPITEAQFVRQGETLLRLVTPHRYRLTIYVPLRHGDRLPAGETLELEFPDGRQYKAVVQGGPLVARRPPDALVGPLSADTRMLEVGVALEGTLAPEHAVDGLRFTAQVPSVIPWLR